MAITVVDTELADILRRVEAAKEFTSGWHKNIRRWRKRYNFDHYDSKAKPGENRYIDPTYTNTVDLAVGILQSNDMIWRAKGWHVSDEETKGGSIVEKTVAAIIDHNSSRKQIDMYYEINKHFVRDGGACIYSYWDKEVHDECFDTMEMEEPLEEGEEAEDSRKYYEIPLRVEIIDPLSINLLPGGSRRWLAIAHIENVSVYDVENQYDLELSDFKTKSISEKIESRNELIDYWEYAYELEPQEGYDEEKDIEDNIKFLKRKPVLRNAVIYAHKFIKSPSIMPGYHSLPYKVGFYNPSDMNDSSRWHSILSPQEHSIKELEDIINMRKRLMNMYSNLPLVTRTKGGRPLQLDPAMGKGISLGLDEDIGFPKWEGTSPDFDKMIDLLRSRVQQSGFSDVMYGEGPSGVSGYALSQLGDQNRIRLIPAIAHLENLWSWVARDWLSLITAYASNYYLEMYGQIRGADFAELVYGGDVDGYNVRCIIKPEFPNEKVRNHAMATQAAAFLSEHRITEEYLGVQQPDVERERKLQEAIENHPLMQQFVMMLQLEKRAGGGDNIAAMMLQIMAQSMQTNQGGRQKEPSEPEQPLGLQSPTGEAQPQVYQGQEDAAAIEAQSRAAPRIDGSIGGQGQ